MDDFKDAESFLEYCTQHFGRLNKKDYELAVFHLLLQNELKDCSDFAISRRLKITEAKVKQLRYEVNLVIQKDDSVYREELMQLMSTASYKFADSDKKIQFCVNDKMLRLFLNDQLNQIGSFADSSFNSNIVSVTAKDLLFLLGADKHADTVKKINQSLRDNANDLPKDMRDKLSGLAKSIAKDLASKISPNVTKWIEEQLQEYVNKKDKQK